LTEVVFFSRYTMYHHLYFGVRFEKSQLLLLCC